jgi:hypothetical protein
MGKYDSYTTYDKPIPFPKGGILFYPVKMDRFSVFASASEILLLNKNEDQNVSIEEKVRRISMPYLDYLFSLATEENQYYLRLAIILSLCLHLEDDEDEIKFGFNEKNKALFTIREITYNGEDFDLMREIIIEQNLLEKDDEKIQKELRDKLREAEEFKAKHDGGGKQASLEDLMICVFISAPFSKMEDVYNLPIRKFRKILDRVDAKLSYQIFMTAAMSGMVEFKDKSVLRHWMSDLTKQKYSDVMVDPGSLGEKGLTKK